MQNGEKTRHKVLHVDDNVDALKIFKLKLSSSFEITSVESAKAALEILKSEHFDAIVTDYEMPDMNGLELLKLFKALYPDLPVIFYTGQGNEEVAREAFMNGAVDYLTKSLTEIAQTEKLINSINKAVEVRKAGETLQEYDRRFCTLLQNTPGMVYRCRNDRDWTMEVVNENVCDLTGYSSEEVIDNKVISYNEIIHPEDRDMVWEDVQEAVRKKSAFILEYRIVTKDGTIKNVFENGRAVFDKQDNLIALEGVILDDTKRKKAEEALRESETRYRSLFEQSRDAVLIETTDGKILDANPRACKMTGYSKEELLKKSVDDLVTEHVKKTLLPQEAEAITRGDSFSAISEGIKKDGTVFPVEVNLNPITIGGQKRVLTVLGDLTEKMRVEEALKISAERYRGIFENMTSGVAVYQMVEDGKDAVFKGWNREAEEIYGIKKLNIIGRKLSEVFPGVKEMDFRDSLRKVWETGIPLFVEPQQYKDGVYDQWVENIIYKIPSSGEVVAIFNDVTEKIEAEIALRESQRSLSSVITENIRFQEKLEGSEELYKVLVESASDAIFTFNYYGVFLSANMEAERAMNVVPGGLVGKNMSEVFPEYKALEQASRIKEVFSTGEPLISYEKPTHTIDGVRWYNTTLTPLKDKTGKVVSVMGIARDVTEARKIREELKGSEEKYKTVVDSAIDPIFTLDSDGNIVSINSAGSKLHGMSVEELTGKNISQLFPSDLVNFMLRGIKRVFKNGEPILDRAVPIPTKDGVRWLQINLSPIKDMDGKVILIAGISRDFTDRIEVQNALLESEEFCRKIIDGAPMGIAILDIQGKVKLFNTELEKITGYGAGEIPDIMTWFEKVFPDPENRAKLLKEWLEDVKAVNFKGERDLEITRKDGEKILVKMTVRKISSGELMAFISPLPRCCSDNPVFSSAARNK